MRMLCALFLAIVIVNCSPVDKRQAEDDLSPLNEVYVMETDDAAADGDSDRGDRDKRKIGLKLGISNGIINFVFDKVDSFLDSKTKAISVLDESNKAKNAAFGIDNKYSATSDFLSHLVSQKVQAATGSIGPIINSATTFFSGASAGISKALASKIAPLSSLSGGLSGGAGGGAGAGHADGSGGASGSAIIGNLLSQKIGSLSSLSQSSGGLSGGLGGGLGGGLSGGGGGNGGTSGSGSYGGSHAGGATAGAGLNLGAFANLAGKRITTTTTEDTPMFDRNRVSLDIPSTAFGTGFTLITNVSKVLNSVILNSARRTQTLLEIFKPFFRGTFAIKGLPSDNPK